jgi:hypothetical protein
MSQPIRVEGWAYTPGARVSLRLRFRSQSTYARVKAEFHNPSGGVIKLEGLRTQGRNPGGPHRGRPYGQRTRKRCLGYLRMQIRGGAHRREEMGAHLRRPGLQHPRGPTPLPRPKWGRVPRARASLEGWKPNPPVRWPLTNYRASLVIHPRAWKVNSPKFASPWQNGQRWKRNGCTTVTRS